VVVSSWLPPWKACLHLASIHEREYGRGPGAPDGLSIIVQFCSPILPYLTARPNEEILIQTSISTEISGLQLLSSLFPQHRRSFQTKTGVQSPTSHPAPRSRLNTSFFQKERSYWDFALRIHQSSRNGFPARSHSVMRTNHRDENDPDRARSSNTEKDREPSSLIEKCRENPRISSKQWFSEKPWFYRYVNIVPAPQITSMTKSQEKR
jgi:hypothetical protein